MAFTNTYDVTFPPNTQEASQGAADMQEIQLNVQQRMAAISGLDASKPNFAGDAQPSNWNGILFFATDTGIIYQFNNPSWTAIGANFFKTLNQQIRTQVTITGNTSINTVYTFVLPAGSITTTNQLRFTVSFSQVVSSIHPIVVITFGGAEIGISEAPNASSNSQLIVTGGNVGGSASFQQWDALQFGGGTVQQASTNVFTSAINTANAVTVLLTCQNHANGDSTQFNGMIVEYV
jgi:hypothetical protein